MTKARVPSDFPSFNQCRWRIFMSLDMASIPPYSTSANASRLVHIPYKMLLGQYSEEFKRLWPLHM